MLLSLVRLEDVHKSFGENIILDGVSLQLHKGEKMGLVGSNGTGKTTLLKMIIREEEPDKGKIVFAKGLTWGYLSQKPGLLPKTTLKDYLNRSVIDILSLKEQMASLEEELSLPHVKGDKVLTSRLTEKYGELSHLFEEKGGYTLDARLEEVTQGLGFSKDDYMRNMASFSGGEKTRAQLASLLLKEPSVLFLDEPTNSLDTDAVEWLEGYLEKWQGALMVVSHDRYFLDRVVSGITILEDKKLKYFRGNYSSFLHQREAERGAREKALKKQQASLKKDMEFIRNATADERTKKQARSREKRLEKEELLADIKHEKAMKLDIKFAGRSGKIVVRLNDVAMSYEERKVFSSVNLEINWGDRLAVVGPNGAGKSTLLKIITGQLSPTRGRIYMGPSVKPAYFDQEQKDLLPQSTPLETIMSSSKLTAPEARKHLARYLFREEEVFKKVEDLSGGEKSRLAIARMALNQSNFLIMDEPTNHLDIKGVEELEATLDNFPGTLLMVSHDRYFISRLAKGFVDVRKGKIRLFRGNYQEYIQSKDEWIKKQGSPVSMQEEKQKRTVKWEKEKEKQRRLEAQEKRKKRLQEDLKKLESKVDNEEEKVASLEKQLECPEVYQDFDEARKVMDKLAAAKEKLDYTYDLWTKTSQELEELSLSYVKE